MGSQGPHHPALLLISLKMSLDMKTDCDVNLFPFRVDTNGLWDEMHCTNNVKNYACQIPVGTEGTSNPFQKKHTPFSVELVLRKVSYLMITYQLSSFKALLLVCEDGWALFPPIIKAIKHCNQAFKNCNQSSQSERMVGHYSLP